MFAPLFGADEKVEEPLFFATHAQVHKSGGLILEYKVYVPVTEAKVIRDGDKERTVLSVRKIAEMRARVVSANEFEIVDIQWNKVSDEVIQSRLGKRSKVYHYKGGPKPMVSELKKLGEDALIVIYPKKPLKK